MDHFSHFTLRIIFVFIFRKMSAKEVLAQFGIRVNTSFTAQQVARMQDLYNTNPYPSKEEKEALAASIGVSLKRLSHWFNDQRYKEKAKE